MQALLLPSDCQAVGLLSRKLRAQLYDIFFNDRLPLISVLGGLY